MRAAVALAALLAVTGAARAELALSDVEGRTLEQCDEIRQAHPRDVFSYLCYYMAAGQPGQGDEAARRLEGLLEADPQDPGAALYVGLIRADRRQAGSEELFRRAADGFAREGAARGEVWARISLAVNLRYQRRFDESGAELERAAAVAASTGDASLGAEVELTQGWNAYTVGQHGPAWTLFRRAASVLVPGGPFHLQVHVQDGLAATAWALGMYEEAAEHYRLELALVHGTSPAREATVLGNLAFVARSLVEAGVMDSEELMALKRRALEAARAAGAARAEAMAHLLLAESSELDVREALEHAEQVRRMAHDLRWGSTECWALGILAERGLELGPEHAQESLRLVDEAESIARDLGDREGLASAILSRSVVHMLLGSRSEAIRSSLEALDYIEQVRDLQLDREVQARVFGRFAYAYVRLAGFLMSSGRPDDVALAYQVIERMRARMLLDRLDAGRITETLAPGDSELARRTGILEQIARLQRRLMDPALARAERDATLAELERLELDERTSRAAVAKSSPRFGAVRQPEVPPLATIQAGLDADQAMIAYLLGGKGTSGSWALVVTGEAAIPVRLPLTRTLDREIETYLALVARRDGSDGPAAARLHTLLLRDVLAVLPAGVRRLILLPDHALHRIAFDALVGQDGAPLARDFETSVAPSFTTWHHWRTASPPQATEPVLALADPTVPASSAARLFRFAEPGGPEIGLGALPYARREVRTMARLLGPGGTILLGNRASERALKEAHLADYRTIHLAAHAIVDERRPERSAVVLAPGGPSEDGLLQFREVAELDLEGRIVILSACRSASGPIVGGDGVMGLANAFFLAGSRTVVAGLWPLRDDEASWVMERFAGALAGGATVASALAAARRELMARGAPAAAWAGLVVLGDGDQTAATGARPRGPAGLLVPVALVALALVLALALRAWRRA